MVQIFKFARCCALVFVAIFVFAASTQATETPAEASGSAPSVVIPMVDIHSANLSMQLKNNLYEKISPAQLPVDAGTMRAYRDRSILNESQFRLSGYVHGADIPTVIVNGKVLRALSGKMWTLISCDFHVSYDPVDFPVWHVSSILPPTCRHYPRAD